MDRIDVQSKFAGMEGSHVDFAPHMEGSHADFGPQIAGSHADFVPLMERRHSFRDHKKAKHANSAYFSFSFSLFLEEKNYHVSKVLL